MVTNARSAGFIRTRESTTTVARTQSLGIDGEGDRVFVASWITTY